MIHSLHRKAQMLTSSRRSSKAKTPSMVQLSQLAPNLKHLLCTVCTMLRQLAHIVYCPESGVNRLLGCLGCVSPIIHTLQSNKFNMESHQCSTFKACRTSEKSHLKKSWIMHILIFASLFIHNPHDKMMMNMAQNCMNLIFLSNLLMMQLLLMDHRDDSHFSSQHKRTSLFSTSQDVILPL